MRLIRPAEQRDVTMLAALARETYSRAFGHSFSTQDLATQLETKFSESYFAQTLGRDTILLAEENGHLVGYGQFGTVSIAVAAATTQDGELQRLYVHPNSQRQGIGRALIEAALAHPRLAGAETIYLDVWDQNPGAQRLYESFGFKVVGKNPFVIDSRAVGYDLLMARRAV